MKQEQTEQHPLFPSGEWEGFYTYYPGQGAEQHRMHFMLTFKENLVIGSGGDDVGSFTWKGSYHKERMECLMTKYYGSHTVYYQGQVDENGIWGSWQLDWVGGGFHIWPKGYSCNHAKQAYELEPEGNLLKEEVAVPNLESSHKKGASSNTRT